MRVFLWFTTHCNFSLHHHILVKSHKVKASSYQLIKDNPDNQLLQLEAWENVLTSLEELVEEHKKQQQVHSPICSANRFVCLVTGQVLGQVSKCGTNKNGKFVPFICQYKKKSNRLKFT